VRGETFVLCDNLVKIYRIGDSEVMALQGLDLEVKAGELMAIVGASGSGKSTLMNILGGLDRPTAGKVSVGPHNLLRLGAAELNQYRRDEVGFVWQQTSRNLIPYLTAIENVQLPMILAGHAGRRAREHSRELLQRVRLEHRLTHRLAQLSGGEQQRVAIAVALANRPTLLLADEPTGELDSATARTILETFGELNQAYDLTTIIVTHDRQTADFVDRVVSIRDGKTSSERVRRAPVREDGASQADDYHEYVVLDSAGRLQIPPEYRETLDIGDRVHLDLVSGGVMIRPVTGRGLKRGGGAGDDGGGPSGLPDRKGKRGTEKKFRRGPFWRRRDGDAKR
jgi:ABC-type lipoprotein export system ATPase subunit